MLVRLKQICRVSTVASSIIVVGDIQAATLDIIYHNRLLLFLVLDYIAMIQIYFKTMSWMTVCSYHVTYAFQSESTLYSCLNNYPSI